jgi:hypothetical protein
MFRVSGHQPDLSHLDEEPTATLQWKRGSSLSPQMRCRSFLLWSICEHQMRRCRTGEWELMEKHTLHVSIIGGGIGGLAAACALQRQDIEDAVFERNPELREIRAGLTLWASADAGPVATWPGRCPGRGQCSPHLL